MNNVPQDKCPECSAAIGQIHAYGCFREYCPYCGFQRVGPYCRHRHVPLDDCLTFQGDTPAVLFAMEKGWAARFGPNGWESCEPDDPEAWADANRVFGSCIWDRDNQCWRERT